MAESLGEVIRRKRKERGWTKYRMSKAIDAPNGRIVAKWEDEECLPSAWYLGRLADALECSVDELLGRDGAVVVVRCINCGLCEEVDMFGRKMILECKRTEMETEPDGYCKWGRKKEDKFG